MLNMVNYYVKCGKLLRYYYVKFGKLLRYYYVKYVWNITLLLR